MVTEWKKMASIILHNSHMHSRSSMLLSCGVNSEQEMRQCSGCFINPLLAQSKIVMLRSHALVWQFKEFARFFLAFKMSTAMLVALWSCYYIYYILFCIYIILKYPSPLKGWVDWDVNWESLITQAVSLRATPPASRHAAVFDELH